MPNWSATAEDFDGDVPPELLAHIRDWSVDLRPGEEVERVVIATEPRIVLLGMTNTYLNRAYIAGVHEFDGAARTGLWGRIEGDKLIVSTMPGGPGDVYGGLLPPATAQRIAAELHTAFKPGDGPRGSSIAKQRW